MGSLPGLSKIPEITKALSALAARAQQIILVDGGKYE